MIQKIKSIYSAWRKHRTQVWFEKAFNDPTTGLKDSMHRAAMAKAQELVMSWLDNEKIIHCSFCPNTRPLRIFDHPAGKKIRVCDGHYDYLSKSTQPKEIVHAAG